MSGRRTIAAALKDLELSISRIRNLDSQNQIRYRSGPGRSSKEILTKQQFFLLTEGLFLHLFRSYEYFIENSFLIEMMNSKKNPSGSSYVIPKDFKHAREIIKGSSRFVDWHSPDIIISRCDLYFKRGNKLRQIITSRRIVLFEMKRIRDRIAHESDEANRQFINGVIRARLLTIPTRVPSPGEFLQNLVRGNSTQHHLGLYIDELDSIGTALAS
jgi:hypothetical protein